MYFKILCLIGPFLHKIVLSMNATKHGCKVTVLPSFVRTRTLHVFRNAMEKLASKLMPYGQAQNVTSLPLLVVPVYSIWLQVKDASLYRVGLRVHVPEHLNNLVLPLAIVKSNLFQQVKLELFIIYRLLKIRRRRLVLLLQLSHMNTTQ